MIYRRFVHSMIAAAVFSSLGLFSFAQGEPPSWHDPSPHIVKFVTVDSDVKLETLDWGGPGRSIVLLTGSGNTAHVFDDFALKMNRKYDVYGITRRGFGASSHPPSGYTDQRLADDVLQVLDALNIQKPILVGHSLAGSEMTTLGSQHSDRLAGLVYLDAGDDPGDYSGKNPAYNALFKNLGPLMRAAPPSDADKKSFRAMREWHLRTMRFTFPEADWRNQYDTNPDGSVGRNRTPYAIRKAIDEGTRKRDYSNITVPILYLPASPPAARGWSQYYRFTPQNAEQRAELQRIYDADRVYLDRYENYMRTAKGGVRIVELRGAGHYVYFTNEHQVLREIRKFAAGLQ